MLEFSEFFRFFCALATGIMIAQSGSLTQIATGNNLAGPSTLGFLGLSVLGVILGRGEALYSLLFFFFLVTVLFFFSRKSLKVTGKIILMGLCFNLLIGALFSLIQFLFVGLGMEFPVMIWFGSFKEMTSLNLTIFLILFFLLTSCVWLNAQKFSLLALGESLASSYIQDFEKVQKKALFFSLLLCGVVVSFFGVFSFLGLVFPLTLRRFRYFKKDATRELVPGSILSGMFVMFLDILCYYFPIQGVELPVGMISSVLGSLILMSFLLKRGINT